MRRIEYTRAFRRDWKRERAGAHRRHLEAHFPGVVTLLAGDRPLPVSAHDHPLLGEWKDHRDCHVRPDLVLIYRKAGHETLQLVRLGSHSELFG
jgi:mRNA interferase YafQ